jgi:hypothetical protein
VPQDVSARILREARAQQDELDAEDLQQMTAAAAGPAQIPAGAIAAALQQLHDSDSEGGEDFDGFTEAGSVWGGDDVSSLLCLLALAQQQHSILAGKHQASEQTRVNCQSFPLQCRLTMLSGGHLAVCRSPSWANCNHGGGGGA